jgi:hypothetical protein
MTGILQRKLCQGVVENFANSIGCGSGFHATVPLRGLAD